MRIGESAPYSMAGAFTGGAEFRSGHGTPGDRGFVEALYADALGRAPDRAGLDHWTRLLDSGAAGRAEVALALSGSAEHVALTAADVGGERPGEFGILFA